ncbi:hypothetical protein ACIG5C_32500 [Streptomyces werraensis]|uniref:hypothetical protein n=1 Tax=Streptomyces werraensis TaxID=68284 RepID=UPI0037D74C17
MAVFRAARAVLRSRLKTTPSMPTGVQLLSQSSHGALIGGRRAQRPRAGQPALGVQPLKGGAAPLVQPPGGVGALQAQQIERYEMGGPLLGQPGGRGEDGTSSPAYDSALFEETADDRLQIIRMRAVQDGQFAHHWPWTGVITDALARLEALPNPG